MWIEDKLYEQIKSSVPIPCVDLVVGNTDGELLLIKRVNEPAKGHWWFPGGRVRHGELRADAAVRKLAEECQLFASEIHELGTFDVLLPLTWGGFSHAISTVYEVKIQREPEVCLDNQSVDFRWVRFAELADLQLHPFLMKCLEASNSLPVRDPVP